jgi:transcription elongation GreA/GreB family factor
MAKMGNSQELKGKPGELRCTVEIKRAATGKVETYELIGKAEDDGSNAHHSGS